MSKSCIIILGVVFIIYFLCGLGLGHVLWNNPTQIIIEFNTEVREYEG